MDLRLQREQLEYDRTAILEALRTNDSTGLRLEALEAIPAVRDSRPLRDALEEAARQRADLRALRYRYTDASRNVLEAKARLDSLESRLIPALARQLTTELATRERSIAPRLDSARAGLRSVPNLLLGEERLLRRVVSASELASTVESRYQAARLGVLSTQPDVRVLDAASTPQEPVSDFAPLIVLLSFMTSLALAVTGVSVRDRTDPRIRYPEQVTREMRLPILGAIPHVGRRIPQPGETSAEAIESLRGLRVRVLHALGGSAPFVFTVSSPAPGEGKSFVSANLALSFAYAGYRTVLIDGDVRRGAQHHALATGVTPGLTDVLTGQLPLENALLETSYGKLAFLSSGTRMSCAPELLHSPILAESLNRLRASHDVIIIDSPPLVAGIDPLVLGTAAGNLLLVLRSSSTELPLAMAKLEVADALPVRVIGAVLNDVRARGPFKHYGYELTEYQELEDPMTSIRRDSWRNVLSGRTG
jgi:tyrosine-protein kinase Etk/Wzc